METTQNNTTSQRLIMSAQWQWRQFGRPSSLLICSWRLAKEMHCQGQTDQQKQLHGAVVAPLTARLARGTRKSSTKSLQLELQISSGQGRAVHGDLAENDPLDHPTRIFNFNSPNPLNTWQKKIVEIKVYQSLEGSSCTGKVGGHSCVEKNAAPGTTASIAEKRRCQKILAV